MERIIVYIDGFNLYFGMMEAGFEKSRWLNVFQLAKNLCKPTQQIVGVKYFTSRVSNNPSKQKRQTIYLEALEIQGVEVIYGHYQSNTIECKRCGHLWLDQNEKMTDVNIATHLIADAYQQKYDTAMLISGDSDLVPPIRAIHSLFNDKRVFVAFPPQRHNQTVAAAAKGSLVIGRKKLADSQLPPVVTKPGGYTLVKPGEWH